jgi:hypothetical protein
VKIDDVSQQQLKVTKTSIGNSGGEEKNFGEAQA